MALKLAQFEMIKNKKKLRPIVMLDDLFDKLDDNRVSKVLKMVHDDVFGQLFISDTHPERLKKILDEKELKLDAMGSGSDYSSFIQHAGIPALNFLHCHYNCKIYFQIYPILT